MITTREHCDFFRGYYHDEAFLCSQVYISTDNLIKIFVVSFFNCFSLAIHVHLTTSCLQLCQETFHSFLDLLLICKTVTYIDQSDNSS